MMPIGTRFPARYQRRREHFKERKWVLIIAVFDLIMTSVIGLDFYNRTDDFTVVNMNRSSIGHTITKAGSFVYLIANFYKVIWALVVINATICCEYPCWKRNMFKSAVWTRRVIGVALILLAMAASVRTPGNNVKDMRIYAICMAFQLFFPCLVYYISRFV